MKFVAEIINDLATMKSAMMDDLDVMDVPDLAVIERFRRRFPNISVEYDHTTRYALFNSIPIADLNDHRNREANGLIIDMNDWTVVCWPCNKVRNYRDYPKVPNEIDWASAKAQYFVEGVDVNLYFDEHFTSYHDGWKWTLAHNAEYRAQYEPGLEGKYPFDQIDIRHILDIIVHKSVGKGIHIMLDPCPIKDSPHVNVPDNFPDGDVPIEDFTFCFRLVGPAFNSVMKYDGYELFLTGIRNNKTGVEYHDISMDRFEVIGLGDDQVPRDLTECAELGKSRNLEINDTIRELDSPGIDIYDKNGNGFRYEFPLYKIIKCFTEGERLDQSTLEYLVDSLYRNMINIAEISKLYPAVKRSLLEYKDQIEFLVEKAHYTIRVVKGLIDFAVERDKIEEIIRKYPVGEVGIIAIDNPDLDEKEIIAKWYMSGQLTEHLKNPSDCPFE